MGADASGPPGSLFFSDGRIAPEEAVRGAEVEIDAGGCTVVPGFVDAHTHLPYVAATTGPARDPDWVFSCAAAVAASHDDTVVASSHQLAAGMLAGGTTSFEAKSGLGLSVEGELRHLRLARAMAERVPQRVEVTCLAAHAVPPGKSQGQWVGEAATSLLPQVADAGLASACDVHVNQTAAFAARWGLATADHLNHTSLDAIDDLAAGDTVAVLLPASTVAIGQSRQPSARALVEAGAVVALGSDASPVLGAPGMARVIELACETLGLHPMEALAAATVNAACALGLDGRAGRLELGGRADAVVLGAPDLTGPTFPPVMAVVCAGRLAYIAPGAEDRVLRR